MKDNLSKYYNSKYKSKYLKYKNKYLIEKEEQIINSNILEIKDKKLETKQIKKNLNNNSTKTLNNFSNSDILKIDYNLDNLKNIEVSENGIVPNINNTILSTNYNNSLESLLKTYESGIQSNVNSKKPSKKPSKVNTKVNAKANSKANLKKSSKKPSKANSKANLKKSSKKPSKANSKANLKKSSKKSSKANSKTNTLAQVKAKILSDINWNIINKKTIKKIIFGKNKILVKFDNSLLNIGFTKISDETTWFDKFIKSDILDDEPLYNPDDICNIKIDKLFKQTSMNKFTEYENLVGKQIKSIGWVGDCWMYPSNKQECDRNHVFKIQCVDSHYYLFILRCSSKGGIDADLTIVHK